MNKSAPVYLNLFKIKLPIAGVVSLLHRVTGVLLIIAIPLVIYALNLSLHSEASFNSLLSWFNNPFMIITQLVVLTALFYHLFAGIRFLLMDLDIGYEKATATRSAWLVILASVVSGLLLLLKVLS